MWLINTESLELKYFHEAAQSRYAILSHTWEDEEVTFQEMKDKLNLEGKKGYKKVVACCKQAQIDGFEYAWVDTCCIDKTSSAELSEAINSMYNWYQESGICYAYLSDIPHADCVRSPDWGSIFDVKRYFRYSRWFTRGWTLQELIAPTVVEFYAADWLPFGTKMSLLPEISAITGIGDRALCGESLSMFNVAERMSWASERETTRPEDKAYCLLGIFGVNMPLLYGEGNRAFLRLQEHILQEIEDYTIFAWPGREYDDNPRAIIPFEALEMRSNSLGSILATDPVDFKRLDQMTWAYSDLVRIFNHYPTAAQLGPQGAPFSGLRPDSSPPAVTTWGIRLCLPLAYLGERAYIASLHYSCHSHSLLICIPLVRDEFHPERFYRDLENQCRIRFSHVSDALPFARCQIYVERLHRHAFQTKGSGESQLPFAFDPREMIKKANQYDQEGDFEAAHAAFYRATALSQRVYGDGAWQTLDTIFGHFEFALRVGRYSEAENLALELAEISKSQLPKGNYSLSLTCHAAAYFYQSRYEIGEALLENIVAACDSRLQSHEYNNLFARGMQTIYQERRRWKAGQARLAEQNIHKYLRQAMFFVRDEKRARSAERFRDSRLESANPGLRRTTAEWTANLADTTDVDEVLSFLCNLTQLTKGAFDELTIIIKFLHMYVSSSRSWTDRKDDWHGFIKRFSAIGLEEMRPREPLLF